MDRSSLKGHKAERDVHKKETGEKVHNLSKTEVDVVKVSDQVGSIQSKLNDVNEMIRAERSRVLDTAEKAGDQDASKVQAEERKTAEHKQAVESTEHETRIERQKATSIRPNDSRIRDGAEIVKLLDQAGAELKGIASDLRSVESGAKAQREKSQGRIASAIRKNRN
jgi:hypothetical protein